MNNPKYIRIFSDIHLDFDIPSNLKNFSPQTDIWSPVPLVSDPETILILAGDIWHAKKPFKFMGFSWIKKVSEQFHSIIIVLGNHDFWSGNLQKEYQYYIDSIKEQGLSNVFLLQDNTIVMDNLKFVGGTLWTDYNKANNISMSFAESNMNDFRYIKNGMSFARLKANHLLGAHIKTQNYIRTHAKKDYPEQNLWVITHHLPTFKSIPKTYLEVYGINENALYATNLEDLFDGDIDVWVHGHGHEAMNYNLNKTHIISNPRGYRGESTGYSHTSLFDFNGNII
jgi:predicted phosphohydrolase